MYIRHFQGMLFASLALLMAALSPQTEANALYQVNIDTSRLSEQFTLHFILYDGSGSGNGNNTVQLLPQNFGEGIPALTDTSVFNETSYTLNPGYKRIEFNIDTTTNPDSPQPDMFIFRILDTKGNPIPTTAPPMMNTSEAFFAIALESTTGLLYGPYGADQTRTAIMIPPPQVRLLSPAIVPAPATSLLFLAGFMGLLANRRLKILSLYNT